jgi:hypothetical protein
MRRRIAWLLLSLSPAACGARSDLAPIASRGSSASSSSSSGGGAAPCSATMPLAVTNDTGFVDETFLDSIAADGETILVATSTVVPSGPDPYPDPTWRVRSVAGDLSSMGASQVVLTHGTPPSVTISLGYVAAGFGHRGFVAWDSVDGSRFVPLAADGSPAGPPTSLGPGACTGLVAQPGGFAVLLSSETYAGPVALVTVGPSGGVLATTPLTGPGPDSYYVTGTGLMTFDDGSLFATWEGTAPFGIMAQHLSAAGVPMTPPAQLFDISGALVGGDEYFAMISLGASALVAWGTDDSGYRAIAPADEDGHAGAQTVFGSGTFEGLGLGTGAAGVLASWSEVPDGSAVGSLVVQRMTAGGTPLGVPFQVAQAFAADDPIFAATPAGEVLGFTGNLPEQPSQAYVTLLSCGP